MTREQKWDILFEPVRIGPKVLKNRFYQTPQCLGAGSEKPGMQAALRGMKAEGGWAAVFTEVCSVHPECDSTYLVSARLWDDRDVKNLARTCEEVHAWGALAGVELGYSGANATDFETRQVPRAPSQIGSRAEIPNVPREASQVEIEELQDFFVLAALRAREAGFDIICLYGGSDEAPAQFLLPRYNRRTDDYGGSFENRSRFWIECLEKINAAVGRDCAVTTRLSIGRGHDGYVSLQEACDFVFQADALVDFWDIKMGHLAEFGWGIGASRFYPENYQASWLSEVKRHIAKPVVGTGRFVHPDVMVAAIRAGTIDIVGAARASIADPFLPQKLSEGRSSDIRECIGCNVCTARHQVGGQLVCTQNATAGEEYRRGWHPEKFKRATNWATDVMVVGAGPAGMECAVVLGKRGLRRVTLIDREPTVGGSVKWISQLPGLREWERIMTYREREIERLDNVEFVGNTVVDAEAIEASDAGVTIIATGATWATTGVSGFTQGPIPGANADLAHVLTPEQIMVEKREPPGERVLVYDCEGYFVGVSLAEKLAREGRRVVYLTPMSRVAPFMHYTGEAPDMLRLLKKIGVSMHTSRTCVDIGETGVRSVDSFFGDDVVEHEVNAVVLVTQRVSNAKLFDDVASTARLLDSPGPAVYRVGDCVAPRLLADAIFDGHRLAREIDTATPETPLPFIRERRLVGTTTEQDYETQRMLHT